VRSFGVLHVHEVSVLQLEQAELVLRNGDLTAVSQNDHVARFEESVFFVPSSLHNGSVQESRLIGLEDNHLGHLHKAVHVDSDGFFHIHFDNRTVFERKIGNFRQFLHLSARAHLQSRYVLLLYFSEPREGFLKCDVFVFRKIDVSVHVPGEIDPLRLYRLHEDRVACFERNILRQYLLWIEALFFTVSQK